MAVAVQGENVQERVKFTSHLIQREDLKPGDHIYVYRKLGIYAHHGIYAGKNEAGEQMVIHFINTSTGSSKLKVSEFLTEPKEEETQATFDATDSNKPLMTHSVDVETTDSMETTITDPLTMTSADLIEALPDDRGNIIKGTLDSFLKGAKPRLVDYGVVEVILQFKRAGTAHRLPCRPADEVVSAAEYYLEHPDEWEKYDLFTNNCEKFCIYCKTGDDDISLYNDQNKGAFAKGLKYLKRK